MSSLETSHAYSRTGPQPKDIASNRQQTCLPDNILPKGRVARKNVDPVF